MRKSLACCLIFVYLFLGLIAIAVISWSLFCIIPFRELIGNGFTLPQIIFCVLVFLTLTLSIFGIIGYQQRSHKLTLSYSVFLIFMSILFLIIGVMVILELLKVEPSIQGRIFKLYLAYNDSADNDLYDAIQFQFGCCGYYNYTDWYYNMSNVAHIPRLFPLSCCQATPSEGSLRHAVCMGSGNGLDYLRTTGCFVKGLERAVKCALPVIVFAFIIALIGIPCSAMSFLESNRMRREFKDDEDDDEDEGEDEDEDEDDEGDESGSENETDED